MLLFATCLVGAVYLTLKPKPLRYVDVMLLFSSSLTFLYALSYTLAHGIMNQDGNSIVVSLVLFIAYSIYTIINIFMCPATNIKTSIALLLYLITLIYSSIILYVMISHMESISIGGYNII